jgi:meso-butanediol dehydrogenase/(S,S)-butanediol dehydrogenase/diacetyl reductase
VRFEGRVALVTGAASGIGAATAERLAGEGAQVALVDVDVEGLAAVARRIHGGLPCVADVSRPDEVRQAVTRTVERFGRVDVLVSNAGIDAPGRVTDVEPAEWDRFISVNLSAVYLCAKYVIPGMERQGGGAVVHTASQLGLVGFPSFAAYNAAKGGVVNLTRSMALDYAPANIRVNAVCPGPIDTPLLAGNLARLPADEREAAYARLRGLVPLGRLGRAEEIAACIAFLASDDASFVTGALLVADGGYVAR